MYYFGIIVLLDVAFIAVHVVGHDDLLRLAAARIKRVKNKYIDKINVIGNR